MPYDKITDHPGCPADRPVAVVKEGEEKPLGCHPNEAAADRQIAALMAQEEETGDAAALAVMTGPRWVAPDGIVLEGEATGDGRMIEAGALEWPEPPIVVPLRWQPADLGGHEGAVLVGRIDTLERVGDRIVAAGVFDTGPNAQEAARLVREGFLRGVSVDVDMADGELIETAEGGVVETVRKGRIRAATLVDIPAFAGAGIELVDDTEPAQITPAIPLPASGARTVSFGPYDWRQPTMTFDLTSAPPPAYFADPALPRRSGFHVDEPDQRGWQRCYGYLYRWGQCHIGSPPGRCVKLSPGVTDRGIFANEDGRGVRCDDGTMIPTGAVVLATDHAPLSSGWIAAKSHYDHTGLAVADIAVGENQIGIWGAGIVRPGTPPEMVHALRASAPSVDCRPLGGRLQLIAVLAVNTPGFPAVAASVRGGEVMAVVASAGVVATDCGCGGPDLAALQETLAAQGRELESLRSLTAAARAEAIEALEAKMAFSDHAQTLEAALLR